MAKLNEHGLTDKQQVFADAYLCDPELNATKAYMAAYPKASRKTAEVNASVLLRNTKIKKYIADRQTARSKRTGIDADWVLKRLAEEVEAPLSHLFETDGALKPIHEWPMIWQQGLVAGIETMQIGDDGLVKVNKIKLSDRVKRLELIGKHVNVSAFVEKQDINLNVSMSDQILEARKRAGM